MRLLGFAKIGCSWVCPCVGMLLQKSLGGSRNPEKRVSASHDASREAGRCARTGVLACDNRGRRASVTQGVAGEGAAELRTVAEIIM